MRRPDNHIKSPIESEQAWRLNISVHFLNIQIDRIHRSSFIVKKNGFKTKK